MAVEVHRQTSMSAAEFPIIGIGASAGGIDAFHSFFKHMPSDSNMAFVMILHLPAARKSMLTEILARWTAMPVIEVSERVEIKPNHVYVPSPHALVTLSDGHLIVEMPSEHNERLLRPIDAFFDSLGSVLRDRAVGIVLSGTGSDGALGLKAIKESGGLTLAQGRSGTAPQYGEMPAGAIATGAVDIIAPVEEMPGHLLRVKAARAEAPVSNDSSVNSDALRLEICAILRNRLGHDFSGYRSQTFMRRVQRRMQVRSVSTLEGYIDKLKSEADEASLLFRDLLIRVTSFFRDKDTFDALATEVIPRLFEHKMAEDTVRLWVPGCATGEEAYSLAILLRERMDSVSAHPRVQIFATDIDDSAVATARLGRYPKTLLDGLSETRIQRFFTGSNGSYRVNKEIRELCTFSMHNVIRDPPFSMMSLVSCRNLLIYMNPELQERVIPVFHYALVPGGILLLGGAESVAQHPGLFAPVDKQARIFARRQGRSPELALNWSRSQLTRHGEAFAAGQSTDTRRPSSIEHRDSNRSSGSDGDGASPAARYKPLLESATADAAGAAQLKSAVAGLCEELQSLSEEHQTALEELRSSNEELHSVNEEMQSTNEELETSKEELQSLNEELHTVNIRLTEKIDELNRTNSDLRNLFESTQIATVFLDRNLIIRNFTPAIASIYNLIPSDAGRPLTDIVSHLRYTSLREDVSFVLTMLEPMERRIVRDDRSAHYIMRILPYREPDSAVSGVLVTFIDVTNIVQAEEALVAADVRKDVFLATLSHELRNPLAPIRISAQLLQSPKLNAEELKRAQGIIARQVTHMSSLLDDLLDVSRITRGAFLLKKEYSDIRVLIDEAVEAVQPAVDAKHHTLRLEALTEPQLLEVDPVRITQVITNVLTNAVKYTPSGGLIHLGTRIEGQFIVIYVRDNGAGLTAESMSRVFDMFTRIDSEVARAEGGLGIGLALAKGLVQLHGGRLEVNSAGPGRGSEFLICLPRSLIVEPPTIVAAPETKAEAKPRRILVADDNVDSAESMSMLLRLSGHEVHLAHSGGDALALAKQVRPDIGIFDIGMPDLSGYEVAERIRHEAWGKTINLIAVTGWGQESDKERARTAGFDHHLTKPVDPESLELLFDIPRRS
ncbi:MAG TPA: CheR family methyltransferase [Steroidobacteraceae bacterium]|jgi:two-component system CheB/CheR fusion protein|nr:CheR family methyltransferase [Steroidobacteraceae bacterium]